MDYSLIFIIIIILLLLKIYSLLGKIEALEEEISYQHTVSDKWYQIYMKNLYEKKGILNK